MLVAGSLRFCWFGCCGSLIVYWFVAGGFRFLRLWFAFVLRICERCGLCLYVVVFVYLIRLLVGLFLVCWV